MAKQKGMTKNEVEQYISQAKGMEANYIAEVVKSRKIAWNIAKVGGIFAVMGIVAGMFGLYQKTPAPLVLRVNEATGNVEMISTMKETEYSYGEVVDKFFISEYVTKRESYNYFLLQGDYNKVVAMSDYPVLTSYNALWDSPTSPDKIINNDGSVVVSISSIVLNPESRSAQVNYKRQFRKNTGEIAPWKHYIATVSYQYVNIPMTEEMRVINPLGFRVTGYRIDEVIGG